MKRFIFALLCAQCNKTQPVAAMDAVASTSDAANHTTTLADVRKQAADAGFVPPPDFAAKRKVYWGAMVRGRKATMAKRYSDAAAAFADALVAAPNDARALSEKGYAELLAGDLDQADTDFDAAREAGEEPKLAAQTWFNIGLIREKQGRAPAARSAFAISQKLVPSAAASAKLGGATVCEAEVAISADNLEVADNWVEANGLFGGVSSTESAAHAELCRQVFTASPGDDIPSTACDGDPPYYVTKDYMGFNYHAALVFRGPAQTLFFYDAGMEGGWPAKCQAGHGSQGHVEGELLSIEARADGHQSVRVASAADAVAKGADPDSIVDEWNAGKCADGAGTTTWTFYDKKTGIGLLTVKLAVPVGSDESPVKVSVDNHVVLLEGAGCHERYDLSADAGR